MKMKGIAGMVFLLLTLGGLAFGDSLNVRLIGRLNGNYADLWVNGNLIYVTDWTGYSAPAPMRIIDACDPANPIQLSEFIHSSLDNDYDIAVYENYAYIANQNADSGMVIVDCTDPTNPTIAGAITATLQAHTNFVVDHYLLSSNDVEIYDLLPDPTNPTFIARLRDLDPNLGWVHEIAVIDTILYVSAMPFSPTNNGVFLYDFTNPANPTFIGRAWHTNCGQDAHSAWPSDFDSRYVLHSDEVDCGLLHIWDFNDPSNPVEVSEFDWNGGVAHQMMTRDQYAYIAYYGGGAAGSGLLILDITNPSSPLIAGYYNTPNAWGVDITHLPYIYISDMSGGLYVLRFNSLPLRNVGVDSLSSPADTVFAPCGVLVPVTEVVCNYGDSIETFPVIAEIFDSTGVLIYADTQMVIDLQPDSCLNVAFSDWEPPWWCDSGVNCGFTITLTLLLPQNQQPCNNITSTEFCVDYGTLGVSEESELPLSTSFVLYQNHPNPFIGSTVIIFQLAKEGQVSLNVYDTSGRLVKTLVEGIKDAGIQRVLWDGKDDGGRSFPSGIYFYKLQARTGQEGELTETKKLIILR